MSLAVTSSPSVDSSLLASLGVSISGTNAVSTDLSNYAQAKSAGNPSTADAAIVQLKSDLASEQSSLLSSLFGSSATTTSDADPGDTLLSGLLSLSSNSSLGSALSDVQQLAGQSGSASSSTSNAAQQASTAGPTGTGGQLSVVV